MQTQIVNQNPAQAPSRWLAAYYFTRAAVSIGWIGLAVTAARHEPPIAAALLIAYPAWDAAANYIDARRTGGLGANLSQALNFVISVIAAAGVAAALRVGMNVVIDVFGAWAILSGLFQLVTGLRRRKAYGAQWAMILSGVQSALAGLFFFKMASAATPPDIAAVAPYAAFGAFYFLVSAIWLTVKNARRRTQAVRH